MFIQTEPTPNPNVLKFLPGRDVAPEGVLEYRTIDEAGASPLAEALFELEGVEGAQVHRSWWVARAAIAQARRGEGRATLTLKGAKITTIDETSDYGLAQSAAIYYDEATDLEIVLVDANTVTGPGSWAATIVRQP